MGLARIEDTLFERLPNGEAKAWPERFLEAIPVGADLRIAYWRYMDWVFANPEEGLIAFVKDDYVKQLLSSVGIIYAQLGSLKLHQRNSVTFVPARVTLVNSTTRQQSFTITDSSAVTFESVNVSGESNETFSASFNAWLRSNATR